MKFFDRYGQDVQKEDILENLETGNKLKVTGLNDENVECKILNNPWSPTYRIPTSNDGRYYVRQSRQ